MNFDHIHTPTPPSEPLRCLQHIPFPNFIDIFFIITHQVQWKLLRWVCVWNHPLGHEQPAGSHTLQKNNSPSLSTHQCPIAPQLWVRNHKPPPPPSTLAFWLDWFCASRHSCYRFTSTITMSWTKYNISQNSYRSSDSSILLAPSSEMFLELWVGRSRFSFYPSMNEHSPSLMFSTLTNYESVLTTATENSTDLQL